jgi:hypothetical protein
MRDHDRLSYGLSNTNLHASTKAAKNTRRASVRTRSCGVRLTGGGGAFEFELGLEASSSWVLSATVCNAWLIAARQRSTYPAATRMISPGSAARLNNSVRNQRMLPAGADPSWGSRVPREFKCRVSSLLDGRDCTRRAGCWGTGAGGGSEDCLSDGRGD